MNQVNLEVQISKSLLKKIILMNKLFSTFEKLTISKIKQTSNFQIIKLIIKEKILIKLINLLKIK